MLAHMDHPDSSHPIFHFTTQIPLSSSLHPLHILPHPPGALLFLSPGIFFYPNLSLLSFTHLLLSLLSFFLFTPLIHVASWPALLSAADWMSYCLATPTEYFPSNKIKREKGNSSRWKVAGCLIWKKLNDGAKVEKLFEMCPVLQSSEGIACSIINAFRSGLSEDTSQG